VDDPPNSALAVLFEHGAYLLWFREVDLVRVDLRALAVVCGRVRGQGVPGDLRDAVERLRVRVVVVVDGDDLEAAGLLEREDDM
jgi:hypothetical protein